MKTQPNNSEKSLNDKVKEFLDRQNPFTQLYGTKCSVTVCNN